MSEMDLQTAIKKIEAIQHVNSLLDQEIGQALSMVIAAARNQLPKRNNRTAELCRDCVWSRKTSFEEPCAKCFSDHIHHGVKPHWQQKGAEPK